MHPRRGTDKLASQPKLRRCLFSTSATTKQSFWHTSYRGRRRCRRRCPSERGRPGPCRRRPEAPGAPVPAEQIIGHVLYFRCGAPPHVVGIVFGFSAEQRSCGAGGVVACHDGAAGGSGGGRTAPEQAAGVHISESQSDTCFTALAPDGAQCRAVNRSRLKLIYRKMHPAACGSWTKNTAGGMWAGIGCSIV